MQEFVATLNKNGQRWVPILDPPIHIKPGYAPYDSGIAQDVFVKDITGNPYVGQVWKALLLQKFINFVESAVGSASRAIREKLQRYPKEAMVLT